ncbi:hypothetical protein BHE74_00032191 [Ensete ventricosum]|nr:hypothetical protein BHE74_00032191 [Ensete ventricosum]
MGRGRGSKASDQMRSVSTASINSSNGQLENPPNKVRLTGPYRCTEFISVPVRYPIPSVHWNKATRDEASPRLVRSMRGRRCRLVLRRNEGSRHLVRSATSRRETSDLTVPLGSGRSAYQYPVGPVCTACTGRYSLKF